MCAVLEKEAIRSSMPVEDICLVDWLEYRIGSDWARWIGREQKRGLDGTGRRRGTAGREGGLYLS